MKPTRLSNIIDFIKLPIFIKLKTDRVIEREAIIRISNIESVTATFMDDKECTLIVFTDDNKQFHSPMSVAKIYDLIWQTEPSNFVRTQDDNDNEND